MIKILCHPQAMDSSQLGLEELTAACALESACVILDVNTSLQDSLAALEEAQQTVAMVLSDSGAIVGVLTRDSILRAMELYSDAESDTERDMGKDTELNGGL